MYIYIYCTYAHTYMYIYTVYERYTQMYFFGWLLNAFAAYTGLFPVLHKSLSFIFSCYKYTINNEASET